MEPVQHIRFLVGIFQLILLLPMILGRRVGDPSLEDVYNSMRPPVTKDQWHIHDPSRIIATDGLLMIANTGKAQEDGYK